MSAKTQNPAINGSDMSALFSRPLLYPKIGGRGRSPLFTQCVSRFHPSVPGGVVVRRLGLEMDSLMAENSEAFFFVISSQPESSLGACPQ